MRALGNTGISVNEIGLGGIPIQRVDKKTVKQMITVMVEKGMNFIDTARGYTISEELIGEGLEDVRDKFVIATKSMNRTYDGLKEDIQISLKNLKTEYIDLYQLHNVQINEDLSGAVKALKEAKQKGIIRHIGLTTHSLEVLKREIELNRFETLQFPYNVVETQAELFFEEAHKKGIGIIVMKPLAGGAITQADLALKYILNNNFVSVVIPGMESPQQISQNSKVKAGKYTEEEERFIKEIKQSLNNDFCRRCGYCQPCPVGINIPLMFLCEGYYLRYNLKEWALSRYNSMKVLPSQCVKCGKCEQRCPYKLQIREKIEKIVNLMEGKNE